ncbi:protein cereblon-like [Melanaphis sacchari]|uniref:Protein cereblon n=1 Tax=Melanaphis sacchari TaxID=742174 RepID=A0A2H8TRV3_9HEMI|nr:protein cereblon-like [Melanaphis sacchari]
MSDSEISEYEIDIDNLSESQDFIHQDIIRNFSINNRTNGNESNVQIINDAFIHETYFVYPESTPYDRSLTAAHQYLGDGLLEATGRTVYEEGVIHTIPLIFLRLNLLPGQILPIVARSSDIKHLLKYVMFRNRSFGVCYKFNKNKRTFGTIAEVYEHSDNIETTESFQIKAMGHQRFEILQINPFPQSHEKSLALAEIKIIPDTTLSYPYNKLCLHPKKRHLNLGEICRKRDMQQTQWPYWVYKQFDVYELASRLTKKVKMLYKDVNISDDPNLLSFQVARLGIFTPEQVSELLGIESTNQRLQYELKYWNKTQSLQKFMCARCGIVVCNMSSVFPMSPEGPQGTFCNSWGIIHDMITVTELHQDLNALSIGIPSSECSWFPGYVWTIILCPNCRNHLGWRYLVNGELSLKPKLFYGLCLKAITSAKDYLVPRITLVRYDQINGGETVTL